MSKASHRARQAVDAAESLKLPGLSSQETQDLVRIEKSLQSIGFFSSGKPQGTSSRTVTQVVKRPDGRRIQARAVISAPQDLGLPTTADRDKYMALMKLIMDRRINTGFVTNPVRFSGYELLKLLRLSLAGYHYEEINDWLRRMTATTIMSEAIVFLADRKEYATDIFHVFDQVTLYGQERPDGTRAEEYEVYLSRWQLQNINAGFLLKMDLSAYLELRRDIAKALFGHLHVWFYASRGRPVEKKYKDLCQLLHIRAWPHLSKAKQVLGPSMENLQEIGYVSEWSMVRDGTSDDFKVLISPGPGLLATPAIAAVTMRQDSQIPALPDWVGKLMERGVQENVARQLALILSDDQPVAEQIAYVDHIIATAPRSTIRNPPGLYVSFLRDNIRIPQSFVSAPKAAPVQTGGNEAKDAHFQIEAAYEQYRQQAIRNYVDNTIGKEEMERRIRLKLNLAKKSYPHVPKATMQEIAESMVLKDCEEEALIPTLDEFARSRRQLSLYGADGQ